MKRHVGEKEEQEVKIRAAIAAVGDSSGKNKRQVANDFGVPWTTID
jgi:hypothetical protein